MGNTINYSGEFSDDDLPARMPPKMSYTEHTSKEWSEDSRAEDFADDSTVDYQNVRKETDCTSMGGYEGSTYSLGRSVSPHHENTKTIRGKRADKLKRIARDLLDAANENTVFSHFEYCELHKEVNHSDETKHDDEVEAGIATALCATLEVLMSMQNTDVEIRKTCTDLELIYRCSNECRSDSFDNIGHKLVPMLLKITKMCLNGSIKHGSDLVIKRTVKILGYFALLDNARTSLMKQSGFLYTFVKVMGSEVSSTTKVDSIWMLANLAFADSLREMIFQYPNLVTTLIGNMQHGNKEINSEISATLMNLSASSANRVAMANDDDILKKLCVLVTEDGDARPRAIGALKNISSASENRDNLCSYENGLILDILTHAMVDTKDSKSGARASGSLKYLICPEKCPFLATNSSLLNALQMVINGEVKVKSRIFIDACHILTGIAVGINVKNVSVASFNEVLNVVVLLASGDSLRQKLAVETYLQLSKKKINLATMAAHPYLMSSLVELVASKDLKVKEMAVETILFMTSNTEMKENIDPKSNVLYVLQSTLETYGLQMEDLAKNLISIVSILATSSQNLNLMGKEEGFLEVLVAFTRKSSIGIDEKSRLVLLCTKILNTYTNIEVVEMKNDVNLEASGVFSVGREAIKDYKKRIQSQVSTKAKTKILPKIKKLSKKPIAKSQVTKPKRVPKQSAKTPVQEAAKKSVGAKTPKVEIKKRTAEIEDDNDDKNQECSTYDDQFCTTANSKLEDEVICDAKDKVADELADEKINDALSEPSDECTNAKSGEAVSDASSETVDDTSDSVDVEESIEIGIIDDNRLDTVDEEQTSLESRVKEGQQLAKSCSTEVSFFVESKRIGGAEKMYRVSSAPIYSDFSRSHIPDSKVTDTDFISSEKVMKEKNNDSRQDFTENRK